MTTDDVAGLSQHRQRGSPKHALVEAARAWGSAAPSAIDDSTRGLPTYSP